jgi:hypothetical protein
MHENTLQWYNWIPTNLGILDYDFISKQQMSSSFGKNIKFSEDIEGFRFWNLDLRSFQDSLPSYLTLSKGKETSGIGRISFYPSAKKILKGLVTIDYHDKFNISFEYYLEINGKVCISNPSFGLYNQIKDINNDLLNTFAQIAYMILKQSLHGDSHHHQKIDYVLEVQEGVFSSNKIIYTFAKHIKNVERDIKSIDTCIGHLKAINAIEEIRGYISYANTFYELNKDKISPESETLVKNMQNVVLSLEATVAKKDNHFKYLDIAKTTFLAIFALLISLSLFLFKTFIENIEDFFALSVSSIIVCTILLAISIFYWLRKCYIKSYIFYEHYSLYEEYKYLSWISLEDASLKVYGLKIVIPISLILISSYYLYIS